jgi:hypothetical protein
MIKLGAWAVSGLLGLFLAGSVWAQPQGMAPGWGRLYDPKTVETVKGEVVSVETVTAGRMDIPGRLILNLQTAKETIPVHLGPEWYVNQQGLKLVAGDQVEVRGSRVSVEGKPSIVANYVKKNQRVLNLRDDRGLPLWAGQGHRPGR